MSSVARNARAGALIKELRLDLGFSAEDLSHDIYKQGVGTVSARTIRRIEAIGMVPRIRIQFALAQYFGRTVSSIWVPSQTVRIDEEEMVS